MKSSLLLHVFLCLTSLFTVLQAQNAQTSMHDVAFRTDVSNAIVKINGKSLVVQNGMAITKLPTGRYNYAVMAPKYEKLIGILTVEDIQARQEVVIEMVSAYRQVTLSAGEGVEIWLDGELKGIGSWTGELEYSTYSVECRKTSHHTAYQELTITRGGPSAFQLTAPSPMFGSIEVENESIDAIVFLDGIQIGTVPLRIDSVLVGNHHIKVSLKGYADMEIDVVVNENVVQSVTGKLMESVRPAIIEDVTGVHCGHQYVDLGLPSRTLWATCNIGAEKPDEAGDYFAWGETSGYNGGKDEFVENNYKWCKGTYYSLTKYRTYDEDGRKVDNLKELEVDDDAAAVNWGGKWRIPSKRQFEELIRKCDVKEIFVNGKHVWKVISKRNGKSIYLVSTGYRQIKLSNVNNDYYWSRSLYEGGDSFAVCMSLFMNFAGLEFGFESRYKGLCVRPVICK